MSKRPLSTQRRFREWTKTALGSSAVKRVITTLTIPSVLTGCAHHGAVHPTQAHATGTSAAKTYHVMRAKAHSADPRGLDDPGGDPKYSDLVIVENILARKTRIADAVEAHFGAGRAKPNLTMLRRGHKLAAFKPLPGKLGDVGFILDRLRERLVLADIEHEEIYAQIDAFQRQPGTLDYLLKRARPLLPYLIGEIDRQGLPGDLALVPMVESAFDPSAISPKQAAGLWQIIPSTGQQYGLKVSDTYDARYDVQASTTAALTYLKHLNELFDGDWLLSLAAYNAGEGTVQRAMEANQKSGRGTSFWDLKLPAETRAYVPKIAALAHLFASPDVFQFKAQRASDAPSLVRVDVDPTVRPADVISVAGMTADEFRRLNPAFKSGLEPPSDSYSLLLPLEKARPVAAQLPGTKLVAAQHIVVKKGETLRILARRHGVSPLELAEWNGLSPKSALKPGQELVVFPA